MLFSLRFRRSARRSQKRLPWRTKLPPHCWPQDAYSRASGCSLLPRLLVGVGRPPRGRLQAEHAHEEARENGFRTEDEERRAGDDLLHAIGVDVAVEAVGAGIPKTAKDDKEADEQEDDAEDEAALEGKNAEDARETVVFRQEAFAEAEDLREEGDGHHLD